MFVFIMVCLMNNFLFFTLLVLSLYGVFESSSLFGVFASSYMVFSAAYTMYMYQSMAFGGAYSSMFTFSLPDLTKSELTILLMLVMPTVLFGMYPAPMLDGIHYSVSAVIYCFDEDLIICGACISLPMGSLSSMDKVIALNQKSRNGTLFCTSDFIYCTSDFIYWMSMWSERWFLSSNAKDMGTLYLMFALFLLLVNYMNLNVN